MTLLVWSYFECCGDRDWPVPWLSSRWVQNVYLTVLNEEANYVLCEIQFDVCTKEKSVQSNQWKWFYGRFIFWRQDLQIFIASLWRYFPTSVRSHVKHNVGNESESTLTVFGKIHRLFHLFIIAKWPQLENLSWI